MKHYGEYEREAVVILGYNAAGGRMMVVQLDQLNSLQQDFLAKVVKSRINSNDSIIPDLQSQSYNGADAFTHFSSFAIQVPVHFVKMADRSQAEYLTRSSAPYSDRIVEHSFQRLVLGDDYQSRADAVATRASVTGNVSVASAVNVGSSLSSPPTSNPDLETIKLMMAGILDRLTVIEANQLNTSVVSAFPNAGPFAAPVDSDGK